MCQKHPVAWQETVIVQASDPRISTERTYVTSAVCQSWCKRFICSFPGNTNFL